MYCMTAFNSLARFNILSICIIAFVVRAVWAFLVAVDPVADSYLYNAFAHSIASGNGYAFPAGNLTVYWPVGTSAIYAALYFLFGKSFLPIVLFNLVIGTAIVWLAHAIAARYLSKVAANLTAIFIACWPILIEFTTILASELIFIFFILAAIYVWGSKQLQPTFRAILWGACICAATYIRPTALPLLALFPALSWFSGEKLRHAIVHGAIAVITAAILFAPWVYRNHTLFHQFVLVSANGGVNLWMGNNPQSNGGYMELPEIAFENEVARDRYFKQQAVDFIAHNPLSYLQLMVKRAITTYKSETIGIVWNGDLYKHLNSTSLLVLKLLSTLYWWLMISCALLGFYYLCKRKPLPWHHVLFAVSAFFFVLPIFTVAQDRYHLPLDPFIAIFAAYAIEQILKRRHSPPLLNTPTL